MPIIDVEQQTPEWLALRHGRVTASEVWRVMKERQKGDKTKELAEKANYRRELLVERLTRHTVDSYVTDEMIWGIEQQPFAQTAYEAKMDFMVEPVGFAIHNSIEGFGASPDGLVNDDGLVEYKCLKTENHLEIFESKQIPEKFLWQVQAEMACTGRLWCDFVSFDPRLPFHLQTFVQRVPRASELIEQMEQSVTVFLAEIDKRCLDLGVKFEFCNAVGVR